MGQSREEKPIVNNVQLNEEQDDQRRSTALEQSEVPDQEITDTPGEAGDTADGDEGETTDEIVDVDDRVSEKSDDTDRVTYTVEETIGTVETHRAAGKAVEKPVEAKPKPLPRRSVRERKPPKGGFRPT